MAKNFCMLLKSSLVQMEMWYWQSNFASTAEKELRSVTGWLYHTGMGQKEVYVPCTYKYSICECKKVPSAVFSSRDVCASILGDVSIDQFYHFKVHWVRFSGACSYDLNSKLGSVALIYYHY